eukprot:CAMPEP_0119301236 /NCGR_PEP_ID=MMETSP1333-20130426/3044_1 /TAXON_ID=418940 /ORGANISM="Scyphosphaera apsteinii, Strain RCC1455" /LENGTH=1118 /DNA_ID=CAMNT_0007303257 /DNA_START=158 /DNA_END=3514 /DNA_ORIENTATION=+
MDEQSSVLTDLASKNAQVHVVAADCGEENILSAVNAYSSVTLRRPARSAFNQSMTISHKKCATQSGVAVTPLAIQQTRSLSPTSRCFRPAAEEQSFAVAELEGFYFSNFNLGECSQAEPTTHADTHYLTTHVSQPLARAPFFVSGVAPCLRVKRDDHALKPLIHARTCAISSERLQLTVEQSKRQVSRQHALRCGGKQVCKARWVETGRVEPCQISRFTIHFGSSRREQARQAGQRPGSIVRVRQLWGWKHVPMMFPVGSSAFRTACRLRVALAAIHLASSAPSAGLYFAAKPHLADEGTVVLPPVFFTVSEGDEAENGKKELFENNSGEKQVESGDKQPRGQKKDHDEEVGRPLEKEDQSLKKRSSCRSFDLSESAEGEGDGKEAKDEDEFGQAKRGKQRRLLPLQAQPSPPYGLRVPRRRRHVSEWCNPSCHQQQEQLPQQHPAFNQDATPTRFAPAPSDNSTMEGGEASAADAASCLLPEAAGTGVSPPPRGVPWTLPHAQKMVGNRIRVFWDGVDEWFAGVAKKARQGMRGAEVCICYDDGDRKWHELWLDSYELVIGSTLVRQDREALRRADDGGRRDHSSRPARHYPHQLDRAYNVRKGKCMAAVHEDDEPFSASANTTDRTCAGPHLPPSMPALANSCVAIPRGGRQDLRKSTARARWPSAATRRSCRRASLKAHHSASPGVLLLKEVAETALTPLAAQRANLGRSTAPYPPPAVKRRPGFINGVCIVSNTNRPTASISLAGELLRRAVRRCEEQLPQRTASLVSWLSLRALLTQLALLQDWLANQALGDELQRRRPRRVCFSSFDASHLAPACYGASRSAELETLEEASARFFDTVMQQCSWRDNTADAAAHELLDVVDKALEHVAARECGGLHTAGLHSTVGFMRGELLALQHGGGRGAMWQRLSEMLRSLLRQALRELFEAEGDGAQRSKAMLLCLPRGRALGFLRPDGRSAAQILSNALFYYHQHAPAALQPAMQALLTAQCRSALNALPDEQRDALLCWAEAVAALRHMCTHASMLTAMLDAPWQRLQLLLQMVQRAGCIEEFLFLPLGDVAAFIQQLRMHEQSALQLRQLLVWQTPQMPVRQRTRLAHKSSKVASSSGEVSQNRR